METDKTTDKTTEKKCLTCGIFLKDNYFIERAEKSEDVFYCINHLIVRLAEDCYLQKIIGR